MNIWMTLRVALKSLLANKLRSVLAILGVIIGVGSVISMLALGAGGQKRVIDTMSALGTNLLVVRPGQRGTGGVMSGTQQNLVLEDAEAILQVPGVESIAPVVSSSAQVKYLSRNTRSTVTGTSVTYLPVRSYEVEFGAAFTEQDVERMARVAIIGPLTAENVFGAQDPVGQNVKLKDINFRVVGVLKSKGDQGWFNPDDQVIVPYTTAMKQLFGLTNLREIDIKSQDGADLTAVQDAVLALIRKRHRVAEGAPDDITIRNQADMQEAQQKNVETFTMLLAGIAGISLLVGGIGIMNIMLVTVTERTREIGVRKAIGARDKDIMRQFLIEALLMSGLGGLSGVALGIGVAAAIPRVSDMPAIVDPKGAFVALGFSVAVGIFFGWYPARRAASLDPIEALRYE